MAKPSLKRWNTFSCGCFCNTSSWAVVTLNFNSQWEVCVQVGSCCLNKYTILCLYLLKCTSLSPWEKSFLFFPLCWYFYKVWGQAHKKYCLIVFNQHFAVKLGVSLCLCKDYFYFFFNDTRCYTLKVIRHITTIGWSIWLEQLFIVLKCRL